MIRDELECLLGRLIQDDAEEALAELLKKADRKTLLRDFTPYLTAEEIRRFSVDKSRTRSATSEAKDNRRLNLAEWAAERGLDLPV